jgi:hypothetical protein
VKRIVAGLLTIAALMAIVRWKSGTKASVQPLESPEACVQRMFQSASEGNLDQYFACFSQSMRQQLQQDLPVDSESASKSLRASTANLKGWALVDPPGANGGSKCELTVEWIYATRVDKQKLELQRVSDGWLITRVERIQPVQPAIPYGTPVFGVAPENTDSERKPADGNN